MKMTPDGEILKRTMARFRNKVVQALPRFLHCYSYQSDVMKTKSPKNSQGDSEVATGIPSQ